MFKKENRRKVIFILLLALRRFASNQKRNFPPVLNLLMDNGPEKTYFVSISTVGAVFSCFNNSCSNLLYAATLSPLPGTLSG
jgi:hypothetical protein